jgi:hypothetical protein
LKIDEDALFLFAFALLFIPSFFFAKNRSLPPPKEEEEDEEEEEEVEL